MAQQNYLTTLREGILKSIPAEAGVTKIEFEGPEIAVYVKNPSVLLSSGDIVKAVAKTLRKRIVLRPDPEVRKDKEEAKKLVYELVPPEAGISNVYFDNVMGEMIIEAKKPGLVIGKNSSLLKQLLVSTLWRPVALRTSPLKSRFIESVSALFYKNSSYRLRMLKEVGRRIHRPLLYKVDNIRITSLGGFKEVGRSAVLVDVGEDKILLDCGAKPGVRDYMNEFPAFWIDEFDVDSLSAVVITHAHLDHCGALPLLFKYGYRGPVYCSEPTKMLMALILKDYLDVAEKEGRTPIYGIREVKMALLHTISLNHGEVTDIAPGVKLTLHNSGHILGSSMVHLHIGEGLHNIVYTSDFKYGRTRLLEPATYVFPRLETLIMESTYGGPNDVMPSREETEAKLIEIVNRTLERGGKVLIPVLAVGRAQEIMLVLANAVEKKLIPSIPIYIEGMIQESTAIHTAYPESLAKEIRDKIFYEDVNPFLAENFVTLSRGHERLDIVEGEPCIILATSGMLNAGPALEYFKLMSEDERNSLIFVSYQVEGTLGRIVQEGAKEVIVDYVDGKPIAAKVKMEVHTCEGFSGHSDRKQLLRFVERVAPKPHKIILCHGESEKIASLASSIERYYKIPTLTPDFLDSVRIR
ncbi:MAG: beta-CASP ribonuclease aCPSF1 [Candidatus Nezhaarchaeales archaeon]|nr:MAG: beta-CASP ribonuclease aCPSF1 [Candidatus Nezhaarchaeota archaeon WYZ-LMO7]TDA36360.1 MAG: beta-CASP ribonuclease aCPSF1 [Candidatus Nezhaarchaeota archaeon WYZ-LMO8]